ncbi:MAG TPA: hypothetical protein EYP30_03980, partial [Archaeoglobaceae archaeon]|nr:hypothetical protein [Archaeoglobaceae archaeon]
MVGDIFMKYHLNRFIFGGAIPMKILYFAQSIDFEGIRGASIHVREVTKNLVKNNDVILICKINNIQQNINNLIIKKVRYLEFPYLQKITSILYSFLIGLISIIVYRPDVVYQRAYIFDPAVIFKKIIGIPLIEEVNGLVLDERVDLTKYRRWIYKHLENFSLHSADMIIAVTPGIKKQLQKMYNIQSNKIIVIPNGANTDFFKSIDIIKSRKELKLDQNNMYIGFVGSLYFWQGIEYLIQAAPFILEKHPNTRFLIVG